MVAGSLLFVAILFFSQDQSECTFFWSARIRYLHTSQPFGSPAQLIVQQAETRMTQNYDEAKAMRDEIFRVGWAQEYFGPDPESHPTEFRVAPGSLLSNSVVRYCCRPSAPFPWVCHEDVGY